MWMKKFLKAPFLVKKTTGNPLYYHADKGLNL